MGPLDGIRILDLTNVLMGPFATLQLADMGADVIKVESPDGDIVREIGPGRTPKMGGMFLQTNRNKRSVVLDLKQAAGREALLQIAATADVMVSNVRPKALERLQLDYDAVRQVRPDIIYASLVGFGQDGPYAAKPAYDDLIQGASGIPSLIAAAGDGTPRYVPVNIADRTVGLFAAQAIMAAIIHRMRTGQGQAIEIPMFETMAGFVLGDHFGGLSYSPPLDGGGYKRLMSRNRRPYQTSDGYICVLIYNDKQWSNFFGATGRQDLATDPRFVDYKARLHHIDEVYAEAGRIFLTRTTAEWREILAQADIPNTPMHTLASIQDDPHLEAVSFFQDFDHPIEGRIKSTRIPSRWSQSQPELRRGAPGLGEHTGEILAEAGLSEAQIDGLLSSGVARTHGAFAPAGQKETI